MTMSITTSEKPKEVKFTIQDLFFTNFKAKLDKNSRLLFSGKFGVGKSYFLQEFFEKSSYKDEYNCVHLSPVYYSTAKNEDIFQSIEADIFVHLLDKDLIKEEVIENHAHSLLISQYLLNNAKELGNDTLDIVKGFVPVISVFQRYFDVIAKHLKKFEKYKEQMQKDQVFQAYKEIAEKNNTNTASVYGRTPYQNMLADALQEIKENKENVLIIDDLDRIDPAHIFRILNVFSACLKADDKADLLGFDKVILVCDNENLENIFHHFYGEKTDYQGYISKFKEDIFEYDARDIFQYNALNFLYPKCEYDYEYQRYPIFNIINYVWDCLKFTVMTKSKKEALKRITMRELLRTPSFRYDDNMSFIKGFHNNYVRQLFRSYEIDDIVKLYEVIKADIDKKPLDKPIEDYFNPPNKTNQYGHEEDLKLIQDLFSGEENLIREALKTITEKR